MKEADSLPQLSEAEIKKAITSYLEYGQNQGKWFFLRLNSGEAIVKRGNKSYKLQLCPKGTADFQVIQPLVIQFKHKKEMSPAYHACRVTYIEIKKLKGKQSPEQVEFEEMVKALNCRYFLIYSVEELMGKLEI